MNTITLKECIDLIAAVGHHTTVLVQGQPGIGKSSMLRELARRFPDHHPAYFDLTTKDLGDISLPRVTDTYAEYVPNVEFGLHTGKPIILMLDELGKTSKAVLNATLRIMLERTVGATPLPEGSIVFATTNMSTDGLGDVVLPHARNRVDVVTCANPTADEWIAWGMPNGIEPCVLAFASEFPQVFMPYTEYDTPEGNHSIYDPRAQRAAFCTPRSLAAASRLVSAKLPENVLFHALCGAIGAPAAADLMAVIRLDNDLPAWSVIAQSPTTAHVPTSGAALSMVVYRAVARVDDKTLPAWLTYLARMPREAQALFARQVMSEHSSKRMLAATNKAFVKLCADIGYLFVA